MKVTRPKTTISVRKVTNKKAVPNPHSHLYLGETDPAQFIHSNKTHRSVSEAFRDADYACALWRCENDWDRAKEYAQWAGMWLVLLSALYLLATWFNEVMV
jgi:hypothetical protein